MVGRLLDVPRRLAFEAAVQGQVLLSNTPTSTPWGKGPLLPLQGPALRGKTVAVIGPNANVTQVRLHQGLQWRFPRASCLPFPCAWWRVLARA
jgi:hypothetical protein